ncbi:hypothetical protein EYF80_036985 [Liparis tanakae]|uniref:Uncharacterized protein n=1 Tax=Liparis tanakae TaxID=230148 RepID=A0A4Z2GI27_9TELE|nr:hypothetical protein EYF80_036985 [Liparis tanakae]
MVFKLERRDRFPGHKQEDQGDEEAHNPDMRGVRDVHRAALCHDDAHTDSHAIPCRDPRPLLCADDGGQQSVTDELNMN